MTKKDYILLAKVINTSLAMAEKKSELVKFTLLLSGALELDNPNFDRDKFANECTKGLVRQ